MRPVVPIAIAFLAIACGPDPNARLPGSVILSGSGGASAGSGGIGTGGIPMSSGGSVGHGGAIGPGTGGAGTGGIGAGGIGTGGSKPVSGGTSGSTSPGGAGGANPFDTGGAAGRGTGGGPGGSTAIGSGGVSSGGSTSTTARGGSGGTTTSTSGELSSYKFPDGTEPCTSARDVSGGKSEGFGSKGAFCFRTADDFSDYGCSGVEGRSLKINGTEVTTCGGKPPAKLGSFYYFDFGPGTYEYASVFWYCTTGNCPPYHPVPSCGHYPPWQSGKTVGACEDTPTPDSPPDAAAPTSDIDSGS